MISIFKENLLKVLEGEIKGKYEQEILIEYLTGCRWFGGKGRKISNIRIVESVPVFRNNYFARLFILKVSYKEGADEMYLLPLSYAFFKEKARKVLYDEVYNNEFHQILLDMIVNKKKLKGENGIFVGVPGKKLGNLLKKKNSLTKSSLLETEQSNTSILYGRTFILKLFRKLECGINPDVEIGKMLTEKAQFSHTPSFAGTIEYRCQSSKSISVGILQSFVPNKGDAWVYTLGNVSQFFDRVLSNRCRVPRAVSAGVIKEMVGESYSEMIHLLGQRTGELHMSLFCASKEKNFIPEPFSIPYQKSLYKSIRNLVKQVFYLLEKNIQSFRGDLKVEASGILNSQEQILNRLNKLLKKKISAMKIRIHSDYHLGQVLYTGKDFVIIDFEGEPARSLSERRLKCSPLRDIAGMVHSFHYAVYAGLLKYPLINPEDKSFLELWAGIWYNYISDIFINSYLKTVRNVKFFPNKKEEFDILFEAFLLEKAVYGIGYELNNRPDWVTIPLKGVKYILKNGSYDKKDY